MNFYKLNLFIIYRNSVTPDGQDLVVTVLEAKELTGPFDVDTMDTFVRIYLVPDEHGALQTKVVFLCGI